MSWSDALVCSAIRSLLIAFCGTALAVSIQTYLKSIAPRWKPFTWGCLLTPFWVPSLMTGYCYRDTSMALVHTPWLREALYALIVMMQSVPVGVVILTFSPTPETSDSALFQSHLLQLKKSIQIRLLLSSKFQYRFVTFCLLFLLSFQESDLAALMQASGWTEWMFTKHVGGLALKNTIELTFWPVVIQIPFLIPVVYWLGKADRIQKSGMEAPRDCQFRTKVTVPVWIGASLLFVLLFPAWQLFKGTGLGFKSLLAQPSIFREFNDAILLTSTAAVITFAIASLAWSKRYQFQSSFVSHLCCLALLLPGSMGSLALGLLLAGIFQTELFQFAYDTPIPLILGEVGILLPRTLILFYCLRGQQLASFSHIISLLKTSKQSQQRELAYELDWQNRGRRVFAMFVVVWIWAYFEVMLPSILAMPGLAPIGLVLYNNLHYGRIAALGAKLTLMILAPCSFILLFLIFRKKTSQIIRGGK